jgi:hypothetical protein
MQTAPTTAEQREYMKADSAYAGNLAIDPMSLGPTVFAKQVSPVEGDAPAPYVTEPKRVTGYRVQLGAFIDQRLAASLASRAETDLGKPTYVVFDRPFYRVRAGDFRDLSEAEALKSAAIGKGYQDARISREEIVITD